MTALQAEKPNLKLLYLRLTDSAPLIVAREMGIFEQYGLNVELQRETSWATLRDKLIGGAADAAAMLAPMPLTLEQTLPGCRENLLTGLVLSCNGNAITLAETLYRQFDLESARDAGAALKKHIAQTDADQPPLTFATVYPFSSHTLQLRHWLNTAGIDPDRDVRIVVLPPEQMVDHLRRGDIDGYCVGEPWNSLAVEEGIGVIVTPCNTLLPAMPEKVLAVTDSWHSAHPATHLALRAALLEACASLSEPSLRRDTVSLLTESRYLDLPENTLGKSLEGRLVRRHAAAHTDNTDWHLFAHPLTDHGRPDADKARELLALCNAIAPVDSAAADRFRPDLYEQTLDFLRNRARTV